MNTLQRSQIVAWIVSIGTQPTLLGWRWIYSHYCSKSQGFNFRWNQCFCFSHLSRLYRYKILTPLSTNQRLNFRFRGWRIEKEKNFKRTGSSFESTQDITGNILQWTWRYESYLWLIFMTHHQNSDMSDFLRWLIDFDLESDKTKAEMSDLLVETPQVRSLYSKLVPEAVTHSDFWQRYYYR